MKPVIEECDTNNHIKCPRCEGVNTARGGFDKHDFQIVWCYKCMKSFRTTNISEDGVELFKRERKTKPVIEECDTNNHIKCPRCEGFNTQRDGIDSGGLQKVWCNMCMKSFRTTTISKNGENVMKRGIKNIENQIPHIVAKYKCPHTCEDCLLGGLDKYGVKKLICEIVKNKNVV